MAKRILILFGIFIAGGVLIGPGDLSSCGPFFPETVFTGKTQPLDEARFFRGQLDILQPRYRSIYLTAAYRYLTGIGLSQQDQALLAQPAGPDPLWTESTSPAMQGWLATRIEVGAPPFDRTNPTPIIRTKTLPDYVAIVNCGDDAFRNATATLTGHARAGAAHDDLRAWVAAQDQVFDNCSDPQPWQPQPKAAGPSIPAALPATAGAWMRVDRAYQIAAAEFYAGQFDAAAADYARIAADRASPWHSIATYLAARALIRKATIVDIAAAPAAQEQLRKVLADPDAAAWHASARGLARYLRARTEPERTLNELARTVATSRTEAAGALRDYELMLGRFMKNGKQPPLDEDITEWIAAMQYTADDHALAKWRATRSLPWLVAALTYADQPDADLMAAAARVPETSPAFPTVEFHKLRLMPANEARPGLDAALQRNLPVATRNLLLAARMRLARSWDELLRDAPRTAAATFVDGWHGEYQPVKERAVYFDDDAARILNRQAPLAELALAARNSSLPPNLQLQVARAVWVRAILLNDPGTATGIAPALALLDARLKPYVDSYLAAPEKGRPFAAAWLMLNNPGMRTSIDAGAGRLTPTAKIDTFRDNWWCPADTARASMNAPLELLYRGSFPEVEFQSGQRAAAAGQRTRLDAAAAAPTWMGRQAVEWVEAHPGDPRAAEALRLVVRAGHYACSGDDQTDGWVKRAFELLHGRYAKSEAAQQTPFWYAAGRR